MRYAAPAAVLLAAAVVAGAAMTLLGGGEAPKEPLYLPGVINDIALRAGSDNPDTAYLIYLSGWVTRFVAGGVLPQVVGASPEDVVFAYFDGRAWHALPYRAYDYVANGVYVLVNGTIKVGTIIEVRLPSDRPVEASLPEEAPPFARGALAVALRVKDRFGMSEAIIYAFIGGDVRNSPSAWAPLRSADPPGVASPFMTAEAPFVLHLASVMRYAPEEVESLAHSIIEGEYPAIAEALYAVRIGGPSEGSHNLVEVRPAPTIDLLKSPIVLDRERMKYEFRYYVLGPGVGDAVVRGVSFVILAEPEVPADGVARMYVGIESSECGLSVWEEAVLYAERANAVWVPVTLNNSCRYLDITVGLGSTAGTRWRVRIKSIAFIDWETSSDTLHEGLTEEAVQVFSASPANPSELMFSVGPDKLVDAVGFAVPLPEELAVPEPQGYVGVGLIIEPGTDGVSFDGLPVRVTVSMGPYSCSAMITSPGPRECLLRVPEEYIAAESALAQTFVSVAVEALREPEEAVEVPIKLYADGPMIIHTRPMTYVEAPNGSVVATTTYPLSSEVFRASAPYHVGGLYMAIPAGSGHSLEVATARVDFMREPLTALPGLSGALIDYRIRVFEGESALSLPMTGPGGEEAVIPALSINLSLPRTHSLLSSDYRVTDLGEESWGGGDVVVHGREVYGSLTMIEFLAGVSIAYGGVFPLLEYSHYLGSYLMRVGIDAHDEVINITVVTGEMCERVSAEAEIMDVTVSDEFPAQIRVSAQAVGGIEASLNFSIRG